MSVPPISPLSVFLRQTFALLVKDLRREVRTKEISITTIAFSVLLMVIFSFAFYTDDEGVAQVFPGILWISIVFTSTLAIGRTFAQEKDSGCLRALALIPGTGTSLYVAKLVLNLLIILLFEIVLIPLLALAFDVNLLARLPEFLGIVAAGTIGFTALGTLVAAMMVHNHMRDVMLPILLYPLAVPLLIAGVTVTQKILTADEPVWNWIRVVGAMDVVFIVLSLLLFRWVLSAIE